MDWLREDASEALDLTFGRRFDSTSTTYWS